MVPKGIISHKDAYSADSVNATQVSFTLVKLEPLTTLSSDPEQALQHTQTVIFSDVTVQVDLSKSDHADQTFHHEAEKSTMYVGGRP